MSETPTSESQELLQQYQVSVQDGNSVSLSEFHEFVPLFQQSDLPISILQDLMIKYKQRFDLYKPVYVYTKTPGSEDNEIVFTIPPVFNQLQVVNNTELAQTHQTFIASEFRDNAPFDATPITSALHLANGIPLLVDKDKLQERIKLIGQFEGTPDEPMDSDNDIIQW